MDTTRYQVQAKQCGRWVTLSRVYGHKDDATDYAAEHRTVTGEACRVVKAVQS